jgi:hypothetical protein
MTMERKPGEEGFLGRWSRRKTEAREAPPEDVTPAPPRVDAEKAAPQLPPIDELTLDSDFSGFFHPEVDEDLRRSALHKLFSDPHFNVMDGLDTYIDDYSKSEPIPAAMLASLKQAQRILTWAEGKDDQESTQSDADAQAGAEEGRQSDAPAAIENAPAEPLADAPPREPIASRPK